MKGINIVQTGYASCLQACSLNKHLTVKVSSHPTHFGHHGDVQLYGCAKHTQWVDIVGSILINTCTVSPPHEAIQYNNLDVD